MDKTNYTSLKIIDQKTLNSESSWPLGIEILIEFMERILEYAKQDKDFNKHEFLKNRGIPLFVPENFGLLWDISFKGLSFIMASYLTQLLTDREVKLTIENKNNVACGKIKMCKLYPLSSNINPILIDIIINGWEFVPLRRKSPQWMVKQLKQFIEDKDMCFIQNGPEPKLISQDYINLDVRVTVLEKDFSKKQKSYEQQKQIQWDQYVGNMNKIISLESEVSYLEKANSKLEKELDEVKEMVKKLIQKHEIL